MTAPTPTAAPAAVTWTCRACGSSTTLRPYLRCRACGSERGHRAEYTDPGFAAGARLGAFVVVTRAVETDRTRYTIRGPSGRTYALLIDSEGWSSVGIDTRYSGIHGTVQRWELEQVLVALGRDDTLPAERPYPGPADMPGDLERARVQRRGLR